MTLLLAAVRYKHHGWNICCNLNVVVVLLGLQNGFTKIPFSAHMGQPRYKEPLQSQTMAYEGIIRSWKKYVKNTPLVELSKIILPALRIKLVLMKNFVKSS